LRSRSSVRSSRSHRADGYEGKIDEEQMKQILKELQPDDDDYDIKHSGL